MSRVRRRQFVIGLGASLLAPLSGLAQHPPKVARIGFLGAASASGFEDLLGALRAGLRDFGYMEGKNLLYEYRWADGKYDQLEKLAKELIRLDIDVLVTHGTPAIRAAKRASATVPIVMATSGDAVATGLVAGLARPGGNVTGSTFFNPELATKRLEVLKQALPRVTKVAVLINPGNPVRKPILQAMETAARYLGLSLQEVPARTIGEVENALGTMRKSAVEAIVILEDGVFISNTKAIANILAKQGLPGIGFNEFATAGGLLAYGVDIAAMFRRAAYFVDKILRGTAPGDIPVERMTVFPLTVNLKAARALHLEIPESILLRADRVIE